jgi:hypothetical protein
LLYKYLPNWEILLSFKPFRVGPRKTQPIVGIGSLTSSGTNTTSFGGQAVSLGSGSWHNTLAAWQWKKLPTAVISNIETAAWNDPGIRGLEGPVAIINDSCGMSLDPRDSTLYMLAHGGTTGYYGNQALKCRLSVDAPFWEEAAPTSSADKVRFNTRTYTDGRPTSAHTYWGEHFIEGTIGGTITGGRALRFGSELMSGGSLSVGNITSFNPTTGLYELADGSIYPDFDSTFLGRPNVALCKHTVTGDVWLWDSTNSVLAKWTRTTNAWTIYGGASAGYPAPTGNVCCIDTRRNRIVSAGGVSQSLTAAIGVPNFTRNVVTGSAAWLTDGTNGIGWGMEFIAHATDPLLDYFILRKSDAGGTVYRMNATTFVVDVPPTTGGATIPALGGSGIQAYNKFRYVPQFNCMVYVPAYSDALWVMGLPTGRSPVISIIGPTNNAQFTAPATITISILVQDLDGNVSKVEFYKNGSTTPFGTLTTPSTGSTTNGTWIFSDANVLPGTIAYSAKVYNSVPNSLMYPLMQTPTVVVNVVAVAPPPPPPPPPTITPSPDGTHGTTITDGSLNVWTFGSSVPGGQLTLKNGVSAAGGGGVQYLYYHGEVYVVNNLGQWHHWAGTGWVFIGTQDPSNPVAPPPPPPQPPPPGPPPPPPPPPGATFSMTVTQIPGSDNWAALIGAGTMNYSGLGNNNAPNKAQQAALAPGGHSVGSAGNRSIIIDYLDYLNHGSAVWTILDGGSDGATQAEEVSLVLAGTIRGHLTDGRPPGAHTYALTQLMDTANIGVRLMSLNSNWPAEFPGFANCEAIDLTSKQWLHGIYGQEKWVNGTFFTPGISPLQEPPFWDGATPSVGGSISCADQIAGEIYYRRGGNPQRGKVSIGWRR